MDVTVEIVQGDITRQEVDAIVNAANTSLMGGGGVDGAIHRAGGPAILAQSRELGPCPPGDARATTGGNLRARHVVHAVGPVWQGGERGEDEVLASAYRRSVEIADELGCRSVAFPAISTGIFGFPIERAAPIALRTGLETASDAEHVRLLRYVLFSPADLAVYRAAAQRLAIDAVSR